VSLPAPVRAGASLLALTAASAPAPVSLRALAASAPVPGAARPRTTAGLPVSVLSPSLSAIAWFRR
jgi:hypothetical protein